MRGSTTWDRSSTRIAPVVNRHENRERRRDLNRGNPSSGRAASRTGIRPRCQAAGQPVQPGAIRLLGVLRPPRRQRWLAGVPPAAQRRQCPRHLGQLLVRHTVGTFRCSLVKAPLHVRQALVERLARRPAVRRQRPPLRRRRVQREPIRPQHRSGRRIHVGVLRRRHRAQRPVPPTAAAVQTGTHRNDHLDHVPYQVIAGLVRRGDQHPPPARPPPRSDAPRRSWPARSRCSTTITVADGSDKTLRRDLQLPVMPPAPRRLIVHPSPAACCRSFTAPIRTHIR